MLKVDLSPELEQILDFYAKKDGITKSSPRTDGNRLISRGP